MPVNLKGRSLLTLKDFTPDEIRYLLNLAADLKAKKRAGIPGDLLAGKNIVLLFEKTSTRTRCAFEVAALDEGAHVTFLSNSQMGKKESLEDTAKVLGRFYDGIEFRGFKQETVELLAKHSGVPVWNGLTDLYHPTQVLADCLTIMENIAKPLNKVKLVYVGDARNNMGNSLMIISAKLGMHFVGIAPKALFPEDHLVEEMRELAKTTGAKIEFSEDIAAVDGADAIYTDVCRAPLLWGYISTHNTVLRRETVRFLPENTCQTGQRMTTGRKAYARSGRCEVMSVISPVSRTSPDPKGARKWLPALTACSTPDPSQTLPEPSITERHMNGHGCASVFSPETRTRSTSKLGQAMSSVTPSFSGAVTVPLVGGTCP